MEDTQTYVPNNLTQDTPSAQVICLLVALVYGLPGLCWSSPTDHAELFSGGMAITIAELEASHNFRSWVRDPVNLVQYKFEAMIVDIE